VSAHHIKHAMSCPAKGNRELALCTCGAPGSANAQKLVTKGEVVDAIDRGAEVAQKRIARRGVRVIGPRAGEPFHERGCPADTATGPCACDQRPLKDQIDREITAQLEERRRNAPAITAQITADRAEQRLLDQITSIRPAPVAGRDLLFDSDPVTPVEDDSALDWNPELEAAIDEAFAEYERDRSNDEPEEASRNDASLRKTARAIGDLLGRRVHLSLSTDAYPFGTPRPLVITQKCQVCRVDIECRVPEGKTELATITVAGAAARKSYLQHVCEPVERSLIGFTWPELEDLRQSLERDAIRIAERASAIEKLERNRGS
jgi:hypothetical protein